VQLEVAYTASHLSGFQEEMDSGFTRFLSVEDQSLVGDGAADKEDGNTWGLTWTISTDSAAIKDNKRTTPVTFHNVTGVVLTFSLH
jgi:hypothetical protein